ncbi:hypothetical protein D9758_014450 [Tetrapyrgos nigripes]|uniref:Uncharacterized protein n=1 Tax=Tetrapyrgos nigripes TaxID=182062 RepID=A0A8H5FBG5_9AGAR|nr:hypothetical protein D9758_014450 [Tetrapyrgos nigripes]
MNFFICLAVLFMSFAQVLSFPTPPTRRNEFIAWAPHIQTPVKSATWYLNTVQNVTWDVSDIPEEKRFSNGTLVLARPKKYNEHLDLERPLAKDFPLSRGFVEFYLSNRTRGQGFAVCLLGDSGNLSELFTIA